MENFLFCAVTRESTGQRNPCFGVFYTIKQTRRTYIRQKAKPFLHLEQLNPLLLLWIFCSEV